MARLARLLLGHWAVRSMGAGAIAMAVDVGTLLLATHLLHLSVVPASMLGVVVGGVASFALNKYVAFKDGASPVLPQIGRFAASTLAALVVHASLMWLLVERLHGPLLPAKLLADFLVFTCGNLLVMRLVVFRLRPQ